MADAGTMKVELLGGFEVSLGAEPVPDSAWRQRRGAEVVKLLALAPGFRLTREQVAEALWPGTDPDLGATNVRKAAYRARRALGLDHGVVLSGGMVELAPGSEVATDVMAFEAAAAAALTRGDQESCRHAIALYRGDLLPDDIYASWSQPDRERLRLLYIDVLVAGRQWGRLVEVDPANERAHREIMRGHLDNGDRRDALRRFELMRTALRQELGIVPGADSIGLYEEALDMEGRDAPSPAERARALLAWGVVHWERSDLAEAERTATEAQALAIDAGLGRELSEASELLGLVAYAQGRWREVFAAEFVQTIVDSPEMAPFVFDAHMCMCEFALYESDGVHTMADFSAQLMEVASETGSMQATALGTLLRGEASLVGAAQPDQARVDLAAAAAAHERADSRTGLILATERLAQLESRVGNQPAADRLHRTALEMAIDSPVAGHLVPFVYGGMLENAEPEAGQALADEAEKVLKGLGVCDPCAMGLRVGASIAHARGGDIETARRYLGEAERVAAMWSEGPWHAAVDEARAAVLVAEGASRQEALGLLQRAAAGFGQASRPHDQARCLAAATVID